MTWLRLRLWLGRDYFFDYGVCLRWYEKDGNQYNLNSLLSDLFQVNKERLGYKEYDWLKSKLKKSR